MPDLLLVGIRFALFADLMLVVGVAGFLLYAPTTEERFSCEIMSGFWRAVRWLCALGLLISTVGMAVLTATIYGASLDALDHRMLWELALGSDVGKAWLWRTAALLLAFAATLLAGKYPAATAGTIAAAGAVSLASLVWSGHAGASEGAIGMIHRISDALHMIAAAVWIGAIAAFLILLARPTPARLDLAARSLDQFSQLGTICVLLIAATGLINGQIIIGVSGIGASLAAPYGQLLLAKLALFMLMLALAAANRWRILPALKQALAMDAPGAAVGTMRRSLLVEALAGAAILALVAWFGMLDPFSSPPPTIR